MDLDVGIITDVEYFIRFLDGWRLPFRVYLLHLFLFWDSLWLDKIDGLVLVDRAVYDDLFTLVLRLLAVDLDLLLV